MGFMGGKNRTKEGKGFCLIGSWYINNRAQYNTLHYVSKEIIGHNTIHYINNRAQYNTLHK